MRKERIDLMVSLIMNNTLFKENNYENKTHDSCKYAKYSDNYNEFVIALISINELDISNFKFNLTVYDNEAFSPLNLNDDDYDSRLLPINKIYGHSEKVHPTYIESDSYITKYTYLQFSILEAYIKYKTNITVSFDINVGHLANPPIIYNGNNNLKFKIYSLCLSFLFIPYAVMITTFIVREKESKMKEYIYISGVNNSKYFLSWGILYSIITIITSFIIGFSLMFTGLFLNINPFILIMILLLYGLSICNLSFIISLFINNSKFSGFIAFSFLSIICITYYYASYFNGFLTYFNGYLLSPITFGYVIEALLKYKVFDKGTIYLSFNNLLANGIMKYIIMLIVNNIIYYITANFINIIIFKRNSKGNAKRNINLEYIDKNFFYKQYIERYINFNEDPLIEFTDVSILYENKVVVDEREFLQNNSISFLWKARKKRMTYALRHVNFKIYNNEIFAILGGHGSGKTTLFRLVLGLINSTFGTVRVNDKYDLNINDIRKNFGLYFI